MSKIKIYNFIECQNKLNIPVPPIGKKYYEFLDESTKALKCFLVDDFVARCDFIKENEHQLDEILKPIYKNSGIRVGQDNTYAVPGFFVINSEEQVSAFDLSNDLLLMRIIMIVKFLRKALRELYNIKTVKIYSEEKSSVTSNLHFWVLPIHKNIIQNPGVTHDNIGNYLNSFILKETRKDILKYNKSFLKYIEENNLLKKDKFLITKLKNFTY